MLKMQVRYRREANKAAELERSRSFRKAASQWELAGFKACTEEARHWCQSRMAHCLKMTQQHKDYF